MNSCVTSDGNGSGETIGGNLVDDEINEDGTMGGDEDDHDIAELSVDLVLPVELLGFQAKAAKDYITLAWSTASELNNSHFELERSEDGKIFKSITQIKGQGTTLEISDYTYEDAQVAKGVLFYYRLKQVDFDGHFEYSEVRTAQIETQIGNLTIFPNPIGNNERLNIRFYATELDAEYTIFDIYNRSVLKVKQNLSTTSAWNIISLDISNLPAGTYLILDKEGNSKRFVKARE